MRFCKVDAFGHEHAAATGLGSDDDGWVAKLGQMAGIPDVVNHAQAGAQYVDTGSLPKQVWDALDRSARGAPYLSGSALIVLDGARGDVDVYGQPTTEVANAFKHSLRAVICHGRACSVFPANDADLTYSGSWAAVGADTDWPGGVTRAAGANGDAVELDVPADWPGGYGFIVCPETDNANGAVFTVVVDGVTKGTLDTRAAAPTGIVTPATLRFEVPASAAGDTIRATVSSFATAAKYSHLGLEVPSAGGHVNSFPMWASGSTPPVIVVAKDARPSSYGATGHNDGQWEAYWVYQLAVVQEFASNLVQIADLEGNLNKAAVYFQGVDTLSPNETGHLTIAAVMHQFSVLSGLTYIDMAMLALPAPATAAGGASDYDAVIAATPDVLAHWPQQDASGLTTVDVIGGNDGTYSGAPKLNQPGVDFDGQFATVPNDSALHDLAEWSIEARYRGSAAITNPALLCDQFTGGKVNYMMGWSVTGGSGGEFEAGFYDGSWHAAREAVAMPLNGDQHLVATYDGAEIKLYRNANLVASLAHAATPTSGAGATTLIGKNGPGGTAVNSGVSRGVALYGRALTAAEVLAHYKASQGG